MKVYGIRYINQDQFEAVVQAHDPSQAVRLFCQRAGFLEQGYSAHELPDGNEPALLSVDWDLIL